MIIPPQRKKVSLRKGMVVSLHSVSTCIYPFEKVFEISFFFFSVNLCFYSLRKTIYTYWKNFFFFFFNNPEYISLITTMKGLHMLKEKIILTFLKTILYLKIEIKAKIKIIHWSLCKYKLRHFFPSFFFCVRYLRLVLHSDSHECRLLEICPGKF